MKAMEYLDDEQAHFHNFQAYNNILYKKEKVAQNEMMMSGVWRYLIAS